MQSKKERLIWSKSLDVKCNFQLSLARHLKMAGIIARITRSNRERLEKKQAEVNINKSIYDIRPFDDRFVPQVNIKKESGFTDQITFFVILGDFRSTIIIRFVVNTMRRRLKQWSFMIL